MTDVFTGVTGDVDGSTNVQVATGKLITTLSGTLGSLQKLPVLSIYSRSDSADFVLTHQQTRLGRETVQLASGDEYYISLADVEEGASFDLSTAVLTASGEDATARAAAAVNAADIAVNEVQIAANAAKDTLQDAAQAANDAADTAHRAAQAVIDADQAALIADAIARLDALAATEPFQQSLKDSGRLVVGEEEGQVATGAAFDGASMPINTSRAFEVSSHKFTHNNSTHGGSLDPIDPIVDDLLIAMGRNVGTRSRYGTEFYVALRETLATPNVSSKRTLNGVDYFLCNAGASLLGFDSVATVAYWVWSANDDDVLIYTAGVGSTRDRWIDGVLSNVGTNITLPAGWHHVCYQVGADTGYVSAQPRMYAKASTQFANALPVVSGGKMQITPHTAPVIYR